MGIQQRAPGSGLRVFSCLSVSSLHFSSDVKEAAPSPPLERQELHVQKINCASCSHRELSSLLPVNYQRHNSLDEAA